MQRPARFKTQPVEPAIEQIALVQRELDAVERCSIQIMRWHRRGRPSSEYWLKIAATPTGHNHTRSNRLIIRSRLWLYTRYNYTLE